MDQRVLWDRYRKYLCDCPSVGLRLDVSRMRFSDGFLDQMRPAMVEAFAAMEALERGAVANPDEQRLVGHYWLRAPELAPKPELRQAIEQTVAAVRDFAKGVHGGSIAPPGEERSSACWWWASAARRWGPSSARTRSPPAAPTR